MANNYKTRLFNTYSTTHVQLVDSDEQTKLKWFLDYVEKNYLPLLLNTDKNDLNILDIGCNRGYLLAALHSSGFQKLHGIDLSPGDIEIAKKIVPTAMLTVEDAFDYLDKNADNFDVIFLKAMLEHVEKNDVLPLFEKIRHGLKNDGKVIVDVPNMDWLFASHERYMDFTHEGGFTKESLRQVMNNIFSDVEIMPIDHIMDSSLLGNIRRRMSRRIITKLLFWADPEGASNPIWARSIVGVGEK